MKTSGFGALSKQELHKAKIAYLCVLPALLILVLVRAWPIFYAIAKSFTNWDGLRSDFVGLKNYRTIFTGGEFWNLFRNNLVLLLSVPLQIIIGLIIAVLLYEHVPGWRAFRAIYYVPQIISLVILGYLFRTMFSANGAFNAILSGVGLGAWAREWLADGSTALPVMVFCITWYSIGWQTIVILGGMSSIDTSVFEAARLDGANFWDRTFRIVLPMIVSVITYCVVMAVIWTFTSLFPLMNAMTAGGPIYIEDGHYVYETMTLDYYIYYKAFGRSQEMGLGCAAAVLLLLIVLVITAVEMRVSDKAEEKWG